MGKWIAVRREETTILEWLRTFKKYKVFKLRNENDVFIIERKFTNVKVKEKDKDNKMLR